MNVPSMPSSVQETSSNNCFTPASETHTRVSPNKSLSYTSGLYFKRRVADFGTILVGTLSRLKVELCNSTDQEVLLVNLMHDYLQ